MTGIEARDQLISILERDLIGPRDGDDEEIADRPGDRYLTAALYPRPHDAADDKPQDEDDPDPEDQEASGPGEAIDLGNIHRPSSMGLSFLVTGSQPELIVTGSAGRYVKDAKSAKWKRVPIPLSLQEPLPDNYKTEPAVEGLEWTIRPVKVEEGWLVSLMLTNTMSTTPGRDAAEEATFFQVSFELRVANGHIIPRRPRSKAGDADAASNRLIYRDAVEYATGHACSAGWNMEGDSIVVFTTWMPTQLVKGISADGHSIFSTTSERVTGDGRMAFDAETLQAADAKTLAEILNVVPAAYGEWLSAVDGDTATLSAEEQAQLEKHRQNATATIARMEYGIRCITEGKHMLRAFQLGQRAMIQQARWRKRDPDLRFVWRPFQLAFQLLVIPGLMRDQPDVSKASDERTTVDLLWFPTGGGKTEAYLALVACLLFYRRLIHPEAPDQGSGVAAFMRYTLRLLSSQQFERAARVIVACEMIREEVGADTLGGSAFSVGLWVGNDVTPNRLGDCDKPEERKKAKQLPACPVCGGTKSLTADLLREPDRFAVWCEEKSCAVYKKELPVWTVDDDIHREKPSLLIATVDKFAQIVREKRMRELLRVDDCPPDLIIQDELHLISGPLGTMTGLYEVAIERLCTKGGVGPKIIGSTATIRRASEQVHSLFARSVWQFPVPVLDAEDSCFAVVDETRPGRLYVGLSSAGRSPKYLLQAASAMLLQGAMELPDTVQARDPFWTALLYFNSLRELGGALVMLLDDVDDTMELLADLRGIDQREFDEEPMEMTSRTGSGDLPLQLKRLEEKYPKQKFGPVLATNMISVGVDVDRLGLMIVNGQPKSMAEYIQATSRVGREQTPGLVVTCYNAGRARDRSHFETFRTWHQALYREVEASSVTPFAPRARDRALHAPLVAMIRHTIPDLNDDPGIETAHEEAIDALIDIIVSRADIVDPAERNAVLNEVRMFVDRWRRWAGLEHYWIDKKKQSLLISAERAAELLARHGVYNAAARPTPGSMRNVEPSCVLIMRESLGTSQ